MKNQQSLLEFARPLTPVNVDAVVSTNHLNGISSNPVVIKPLLKEVNVFSWIKDNKAEIDRLLHTYGGVLLRGFPLSSVSDFQKAVDALGSNVLTYKDRSSPRHEVEKNIYTSTDHPADQVINMHNEHSYSSEWPMRIVFFGIMPSLKGGQTPIADSRRVLNELTNETKKKFREKGVLYVRKLGTGFGLSWQDVFQTNDRAEVELKCLQKKMVFEWLDSDLLQLKFVRPAIRRHPSTNEEVWFNHASFFNVLSLSSEIQQVLQGTDLLPFNTYFGDGEPLGSAVVQEIQDAYSRVKVRFDWEQGDFLLLDNMLMAHGRESYEGPRKILVAMLDPISF